MPKIIAIFTDGTGNSARSLFKTNVWRLYQALDLRQLTPEQAELDILQQVAYYQDGIGTSTFKPLAVIGGAFGWGLKRNVIDAYIHLCETYQPDDQIFLFGFSRGGFTARVLLGLIRSQGLLPCRHKVELHRYAPDAYRKYRRSFNQAGPLVPLFRNFRDSVIAAWRDIWNQPHYSDVEQLNVRAPVKFIGVWDTVSAYGLPIAELTRGIDRWIWPLSLPDARLPSGVEIARHAIAIDDQREAFHPLLWDELTTDKPNRILQVWFAGMHADVGGGYPHDGLALFPLTWMMREALSAGLRFRYGVLEEAEKSLSHSVPMHDSRAFLGAYYRYQPRRTSAYVPDPDVNTLEIRGAKRGDQDWLSRIYVHESVLVRARIGLDGYAPITLDTDFAIVSNQGRVANKELLPKELTSEGLNAAWDLVWWKRAVYFASLFVTLLLVFYPLFAQTDEACEYPQCALVPAVVGIAPLLPSALRQWTHGVGSVPGAVLALIAILAGLLLWGRHLQRRIHDTARDAWSPALGLEQSPSTIGSITSERKPSSRLVATIRDTILALSSQLHRDQRYKKFFQCVRWHFLPNAFGLGLLLTLLVLVASIVVLATYRFQVGQGDEAGSFCRGVSDPSMNESSITSRDFLTSSPCWPTGVIVQRGAYYRMIFDVVEPWRKADGTYANPIGVERKAVGWFQRLQEALRRRSVTARLFQPLLRISSSADKEIQALDVEQVAERKFVGTFVAKSDGELFLFVNDLVISSLGLTTNYYRGNMGTAKITIEGPSTR